MGGKRRHCGYEPEMLGMGSSILESAQSVDLAVLSTDFADRADGERTNCHAPGAERLLRLTSWVDNPFSGSKFCLLALVLGIFYVLARQVFLNA